MAKRCHRSVLPIRESKFWLRLLTELESNCPGIVVQLQRQVPYRRVMPPVSSSPRYVPGSSMPEKIPGSGAKPRPKIVDQNFDSDPTKTAILICYLLTHSKLVNVSICQDETGRRSDIAGLAFQRQDKLLVIVDHQRLDLG